MNFPTRSSSDAEIVRYIQNTACTKAFGILYTRFYPKVYTTCRRFETSPYICKDLVQEIFLKSLKALPKFKKSSTFSTWLYRICYNHCIEHVRGKNKERECLNDLDLPIIELETPHTLLELSPKEITEAQITHLLRSIKQDEGEILLEKYLQDYSLKEIGQKRELKASAVKMRLARARKRAKRSLLVWNEYYEV